MTNPLTKPINSQIYTFDDISISSSAKDLHSEPTLNISRTTKGKEETLFVLPLDILPHLLAKGNNIISELNLAQRNAQRNLYNPGLRFNSLVAMSDNPQMQYRYILDREDVSVEGTPYIYWFQPTIREEDKDKNLQSGWKVSLVGTDDTKVLFAKWDDLEGIDRLVASLNDKDALMTTLALFNPDETAKLAARKAISELKSQHRVLPKVKMTLIRKMIKDLNLDTAEDSGWNSYGYLTSLFVTIDKTQIPVAIKIDPSRKPRWMEVLPKTDSAIYDALNVKEKKKYDSDRQAAREIIETKTRQEWIRQFKLGLAQVPGNWRVVSVPNKEYSYYSSYTPLPSLWVTKIPEDTWGTIVPAVFAAAKRTNTRGSKF